MKKTTNDYLELKKACAKEALKYVKKDMILGIGSGSTVLEFIKQLSSSKSIAQDLICIPSSIDTENLLIDNKLQIGTLNQYTDIALTIDGADKVDSNLNLIKGGGGALLREKIIAAAAKEVIILVDESKLVSKLASSFPIPVEVIPLARRYVTKVLHEIGGKPNIRLASDKLGPTITDNGNIILDTMFDELENPKDFEKELNNIPGVVANGLFPNYFVDKVIIATKDGIKIKEKH